MDVFSLLPSELIINIFSCMSRKDLATKVSLVCRRFRDLAFDPILWTQLPPPAATHATANMTLVTPGAAAVVTANTKMSLVRLHPHLADALFNRCKMLKKLDLSSACVMTEHLLVLLAVKALNRCPMLVDLKVYISKFEDNLGILLEAIENAYSLKKLKMLGRWNPKTLSEGAVTLRRLTDLSVGGMGNVGLGAVEQHCMDNAVPVAIGRHCRNLQHFDYCIDNFEEFTTMVSFLNARKDTLQELHLSYFMMTDASLAGLSNCKKLHTLQLDKCYYLTCKTLKSVAQLSGLRRLKLAFFDGTAEEYIKTFEKIWSNLTSLNLRFNKKLNDRVLCAAIVTANLTQLCVEGCDIGDLGMEAIAVNCPNLTYLNISDCCKITDVGLKKVLEGCKELQELGLEGVGKVTSEAFTMSSSIALRKITILSNSIYCISRNELFKIKMLLPDLLIYDRTVRGEWSSWL